ncbi:MAG TPA: hypothetical protein VFR37_14510 [Longimicrobium sp.]|nr:hypothetical protein [Longimicrobium sp.]
MQKLALKLDDLSVQSFETTSALPSHGGTVRGHLDDDDGGGGGGGYTDACSDIYSCATCETCDDVCDVEQQRRIILY